MKELAKGRFFEKNTKWWSQSVEGLLSTGPTPSSFYCIEVKFYTDNVHASVTNSMSVQKRMINRRRKRRKRRSRQRKRFQIQIFLLFSGLTFYFCFHPSHLRPILDQYSLVCSWPWLSKVAPDDTLYVRTIFLIFFLSEILGQNVSAFSQDFLHIHCECIKVL